MWRKSEEAKPSSPGAKAAEPAVTNPKPNPTTISPATSTTASPGGTAAAVTPPAPAVVITPTPISSVATPVAPAVPLPAAAAPVATGTSTIGAGLKIRGEITGNSNLIIEGQAEGKILIANGRVTVAATGRVQADIDALEISIDGTVQGNLKARDHVRLGPTSHVQGSVLTPRIAIEDGARLRGKVEMVRAGDTQAAPASKTSSTSGENTGAAGAAAGRSQGD